MKRIAGLIVMGAALLFPMAAGASTVYSVALQGDMISPATQEYLTNAVALAETEGAAALLMRIDTPGGMLQSTRGIVQVMLASKVPIITYVAPGGGQAGSAGVFITMAGHIAAMAPGTNIGAAHPVGGQGEDLGKDLSKKVEEDTRAFIESIAAERGRNAVWAARAVTESVSVTAVEALRLNVVDYLAADDAEVLRLADGRSVKLAGKAVTVATAGAQIIPIDMNVRQRFMNTLANPNISYLLMGLGSLGLYIELSHPGAIFPGVVGVMSLLLAFASLQLLPFNVAGLLLILLALALFVAELFVTSYGLLSLGGAAAMVLGGLLVFDVPGAGMTGVEPSLIYGVAGGFALMAAVLSFLIARSMKERVATGSEGMLGLIGEATSDMHLAGSVSVRGELWNALAEAPVAKGEAVEVTGINGLTLRVRRSDSGKATS